MSDLPKRWIPCRMDLKTFDGQTTIMDIGTDAIITVTIKGPYADLTFKDVESFRVYPQESKPITCEHKNVDVQICPEPYLMVNGPNKFYQYRWCRDCGKGLNDPLEKSDRRSE